MEKVACLRYVFIYCIFKKLLLNVFPSRDLQQFVRRVVILLIRHLTRSGLPHPEVEKIMNIILKND